MVCVCVPATASCMKFPASLLCANNRNQSPQLFIYTLRILRCTHTHRWRIIQRQRQHDHKQHINIKISTSICYAYILYSIYSTLHCLLYYNNIEVYNKRKNGIFYLRFILMRVCVTKSEVKFC